MFATLETIAHKTAVGLALAGGFILLAVVGLNTVSIGARALVPLGMGPGPVRGVYDITEMGIAVAVFAFLPYCQLTGGHASVDLIKGRISRHMDRLLMVIFDAAMLVAAGVGTWRLALGMVDKWRFGETTFIAQIPLWQGYAACLVGAAGFVLVSAFCLARSIRALGAGPRGTTQP